MQMLLLVLKHFFRVYFFKKMNDKNYKKGIFKKKYLMIDCIRKDVVKEIKVDFMHVT